MEAMKAELINGRWFATSLYHRVEAIDEKNASRIADLVNNAYRWGGIDAKNKIRNALDIPDIDQY